MKAIKIDNINSVLIDTKKGFFVWMDLCIEDGEIYGDWNKYIFHLNNSLDIKIRDFQNNLDNFEICESLAIEFYNNNLNQ